VDFFAIGQVLSFLRMLFGTNAEEHHRHADDDWLQRL